MADSNDEDEGPILQLLRAADEGLSAPDPSLKRRILAHLEEAAARAELRRWRRRAILSPLAAALLLVVVFAQRPAAFETQVNTDLAPGKERLVGKEDKSPKSNSKLTISSRHEQI